MPARIKKEELSKGEPVGTWPLRELIGGLMWLAAQTRPDIANAVRAVARYCPGLKQIYWGKALGILVYVNSTSGYGITFKRCMMTELLMRVFAGGADYEYNDW